LAPIAKFSFGAAGNLGRFMSTAAGTSGHHPLSAHARAKLQQAHAAFSRRKERCYSTNKRSQIVFVNVVDPVGAGWVASLARPGGNTTG
jgi:hypothetical protein